MLRLVAAPCRQTAAEVLSPVDGAMAAEEQAPVARAPRLQAALVVAAALRPRPPTASRLEVAAEAAWRVRLSDTASTRRRMHTPRCPCCSRRGSRRLSTFRGMEVCQGATLRLYIYLLWVRRNHPVSAALLNPAPGCPRRGPRPDSWRPRPPRPPLPGRGSAGLGGQLSACTSSTAAPTAPAVEVAPAAAALRRPQAAAAIECCSRGSRKARRAAARPLQRRRRWQPRRRHPCRRRRRPPPRCSSLPRRALCPPRRRV